jgi:hypothetical protein
MDQDTDFKPVSEKNIAGYGLPVIAWDRVRRHIQEDWRLQAPPEFGGVPEPHTRWLATVRRDGRPHVMPVGVAWFDRAFYFSSGPGTQKSKNLASNSQCVITLAASDLDIVVEGEAFKVTDEAKLHRLAEVFTTGGWAPTVRDGAFYHDFSAPSAGPPPWELYEFRPRTVFALATAEPYGATRWRL